MLIKFLLLLSLTLLPLLAVEKTPSDVYSESLILKQMVITLRKENGITASLPKVERQKDKLPRHVLQKTLEILSKVNKYRELHEYGPITLPPVPPRDITPEDVYNNVERLKVEVSYLLKDRSILKDKKFKLKPYSNKTPSDVYRELWIISLAFDRLIGQGFTPTDVYILSQQIVEEIKFLRASQRENKTVKMPPKKQNMMPNHALYASVDLIKKIHFDEKKLWMEPVPIPKIQQRVISPTEVYDSLQTVSAELNRIERRLGIERSFALKKVKTEKTPSDVVQNLEYAHALLPTFNFTQQLNQYPKNSLIKTPNDVYALSEYILKKIAYIKDRKGIKVRAKETTYIYGLKPIYVYVKGLENLEKLAKLKELEGFHPSQIPPAPDTKITPSEVYELILRLDDEIDMLYNKSSINYKLVSYRDYMDKKEYIDKTPSDVYNNLWKISYELDTILNQDYTPNETFILAKNIQNDVKKLAKYFTKKNIDIETKTYTLKRPSDVFEKSLYLMDQLQAIKDRGNLKSVKVSLPKDRIITPTTVYNALRIISGTISEIRVYYGIKRSTQEVELVSDKTPSDVYKIIESTSKVLSQVLQDSSYEN
jgi:dsDNA-binding SOS-regulon protein